MKEVTILIPAYNEEKHIGKVLKKLIANNKEAEIIVIDNNSKDNTALIAKTYGVKVIPCPKQGKGYAMEEGLKYATRNITIFLDADISNYCSNIVKKMTLPILNEEADFTKSDFSRTGGRVTELVVKPLLELLFKELTIFNQPLSGIIAGKTEIFKSIEFEKNYGVDVGILIDLHKNNVKLKQVYIGKIINDSQDWKDLTKMSKQVITAILKRSKD